MQTKHLQHTGLSVMDFKAQLKSYREIIDQIITLKAKALGGEGKLQEACEYALLNGGKRFRPALVFMVAKALGRGLDVTNQAVAIEYFHTASLIADDLPCMDNDDERRNKPTTHKAFGESIALLASYALIAAGYGAIGDVTKESAIKGITADVVVMALENAAHNTGLQGATGGQFLDICPPNLKESTLREIIHKKTVTLFEISFVFGWLFGGGSPQKLSQVKKCASHFGMAFQIADDIGDVEQDAKNGRQVNMAGVFGVQAAKEMFREEIAGYKDVLHELDIASPELIGLATSLEASVE